MAVFSNMLQKFNEFQVLYNFIVKYTKAVVMVVCLNFSAVSTKTDLMLPKYIKILLQFSSETLLSNDIFSFTS